MTSDYLQSKSKYDSEYSDDSFWEKVSNFALKAGEEVITLALKLYYALCDDDTPVWAKSIIVGALGYFISPIDAIPDIVPVLGYSDDLGVLTLAFAAVAMHIKDVHAEMAKNKIKQWFS